MTDDEKKEKDFKVEDRRTSSGTEGEEKSPPESESDPIADEGEGGQPSKPVIQAMLSKLTFQHLCFPFSVRHLFS